VFDYSILGTGVEGGTGGSISGVVGDGSSMGAGFGSGFWLSMFVCLNIVYEIYVPARCLFLNIQISGAAA
jgi:hypothetical protein